MFASLSLLCLSLTTICLADITIPGVSLDTGLTKAEKDALLNEHNFLRSKQAKGLVPNHPPAADMVRLEWSDSTASHAQVWADKCGGPPHGNYKQYGEGQNYASNTNRNKLLRNAFIGWFHKEHPKYTYGTGPTKGVGHYTQIVTAFSLKLGCGANKCSKSRSGRLVCNFFVAGNMNRKAPFTKGPACSKCPAGYGFCKDSLCTSSRVCSSSDNSCRCTVDQAKCTVNGNFNGATCSCECKTGFTGLNCEETCEDNPRKGCPARKDNGMCKPSTSNKLFLDTYLSCPASCGRCKPECKNKNAKCPEYKKWGNCEKNAAYMKAYCEKECGFCKPETEKKIEETNPEETIPDEEDESYEETALETEEAIQIMIDTIKEKMAEAVERIVDENPALQKYGNRILAKYDKKFDKIGKRLNDSLEKKVERYISKITRYLKRKDDRISRRRG